MEFVKDGAGLMLPGSCVKTMFDDGDLFNASESGWFHVRLAAAAECHVREYVCFMVDPFVRGLAVVSCGESRSLFGSCVRGTRAPLCAW